MFDDIPKSNRIEIQIETNSGYWYTVRTAHNVNTNYVVRQMQFVKNAHPKSRVRAIQDGHTIDILP